MSGSAQRSDGSRDEPVSGEIPRLPERLIGEVLGERYRVDALLGEGGIGRVYRATHLKLDRPVAVKVLLEEHRELALQRQRFEREVRTLARLRHPNIVTVVDFGVAEGLPYLVMELVEGEDLDALLEGGGPFAPERAFEVLRQVLKSLAYAHEKGIVHRDLKPSNVLLTSLPDGSEHVEVLDFGLAKFIDPVEEAASPKLTRAGCIVGSPAYMAPEQVDGGAQDARTDLYAVGLLLYELLTGEPAFRGPDTRALLRAHLVEEPPTLASAWPAARVSPRLEALVQKALAKEKERRFASAPDMLAALAELGPEDLRASTVPPPPQSRASAETVPAAEALTRDASFGAGDLPPKAPIPALAARRVPVAPLLVGATAMGLAGALVVGFGGEAQEAASPAPAPLATEAPARPAATNPWGTPVPRELAPWYGKLEAGQRLTRREVGSILTYRRDHPGDPRGTLLLARAYAKRRWLSQALPLYLSVARREPALRGDPAMIEDLLTMAVTQTLEAPAADAVVEVYGDEAREAVRGRLGAHPPGDERARLEALLTRLSSP